MKQFLITVRDHAVTAASVKMSLGVMMDTALVSGVEVEDYTPQTIDYHGQQAHLSSFENTLKFGQNALLGLLALCIAALIALHAGVFGVAGVLAIAAIGASYAAQANFTEAYKLTMTNGAGGDFDSVVSRGKAHQFWSILLAFLGGGLALTAFFFRW